MVQSDPDITVKMPKSLWEAVLSVEPMTKETYTDAGVTLFNAYQQIHQQTGISAVSDS